MSKFIEIQPDRIKPRQIEEVVNILQEGGVVIAPTDSGYSFICALGNQEGVERIRQIRSLSKEHRFTLLCRDLRNLAVYAKVDNVQFRMLKSGIPGAFTFILPASRDVPKRLLDNKRQTIGLRVPDATIIQAILKELDAPVLAVSLRSQINEDDDPSVLNDIPISAADIQEHYENQVDAVIDGGFFDINPSTVVDMTSMPPQVLRQGAGDASAWIAAE